MGNKHKYIGVFGSCLYDQNPMNFLSALRETCIKYGYTTVALSATHSSQDNDDSALGQLNLLELFKNIQLDCIIILKETVKYQYLIDKVVSIGKEMNIPVFSIDGEAEGCYNMPLDYKSGFRSIVRHVIKDHDRKRVNMLAGFKGNSFSEERIDVYKSVLNECGIPFEEERLGYGDFWERPSRAAIESFLASDLELPEAIVCANDSMAITTCSVLAEHGIKVPDDIIVTGFDGTQNSRFNSPTITSCSPDYRDAMTFIIDKIKEVKSTGKVEPCDHMISFNILKSQSCGCEPSTFHNHTEIITTLYNATGDSSWHTLAMNNLVTSLLEKQYIEDIAELLPETVRMWSDNFRFACVKSDLTKSKITPEACKNATGKFDDMTTILYMKNQQFDELNKQFNVREFIPNLDDIVDDPGTALFVRLIHYGKQVYGYTVDGVAEPNLRNLQRCNEFDMFLAHSINTILHNYALNKAYEEIEALSVNDPMTGVYNRRGFFTRLNAIMEDKDMLKQYLYIVFIDMDGLKGINDNFGHKEGDFAITTVAQSLTKLNIPNSLCARFGGDEFICAFFADNPQAYSSDGIKEQIINIIKNTPGVSDKRYPIDFSMGILCQKAENIENIDDLILSADKMMYVNKMGKKQHK